MTVTRISCDKIQFFSHAIQQQAFALNFSWYKKPKNFPEKQAGLHNMQIISVAWSL